MNEKEMDNLNNEDVDVDSYDHIILCMSGGKDSIACLLHLIDLNVDMSKVEMWHHDVDGREGSKLMDWICIPDYCRKIAKHYNIPLYFSWLENGFEGEMLKDNSKPHSHKIETPDGLITLDRERASLGTRLKFPQQSAALSTRWCSAALKIDVGRRAVTCQPRFLNKKLLFITGERRSESSNRAKYNQFENHVTNSKKRIVHSWRPIINWSEDDVWNAMKRHRFEPPVPYKLSWSRSSCMTCIYNSSKIWATIHHYFPDRFDAIYNYELKFQTTIHRSKKTILQLIENVKPYEITDLESLNQSLNSEYTLPLFTPTEKEWKLPPGANSLDSCGAV